MNNKGKVSTIIIIVVAVLVIAAGATGYWFNRPEYKVNKAIEAEDIEKVAKYYDKIKDSDKKEDVEKSMVVYCTDLNNQFIEDDIEYDDLMDKYEILEDMLEDNEAYEYLVENAKVLKESKEAYKKAQQAFENEDYKTAAEEFAKVASDDKNYEKAQSVLEECKKYLLPDVDGKWVCNINIGKAISNMGNAFMFSDVDFIVNLYMQFNDDNTGSLYYDREELKNSFSDYLLEIIDIAVEAAASNEGISVQEYEKQFKKFYGMSVKEFFTSALNVDSLLGEKTTEEEAFSYTVDGDKVLLSFESGTTNSITRVDDTLSFLSEDENDVVDAFKQYGIEFPLVFEKVK